MSRSDSHLDVLVLGGHPCALVAAALLHSRKLRVLHARIPGERFTPDRLVLLNPDFFRLHELLKPLARRLELTPIHGIRFLGDAAGQSSEYRNGRTGEALVVAEGSLRDAMQEWATATGVPSLTYVESLHIESTDEQGVGLCIDGTMLRPRMLIVAGEIPRSQRKILAIPDFPEPGTQFDYSFVVCDSAAIICDGRSLRGMMSMSLNLSDIAAWAWMFSHAGRTILACSAGVSPPADARDTNADAISPAGAELLGAWINTLKRHKELRDDAHVSMESARTIRIAQGGALAQEGVANRTLLIGPAGGFYSACAEEIYPCCWSALFAADVARKALHEPHLQDALGAFRHKWRTTLGDYLRGPQQNLRYLLPLVYRNPVMTTRVAEAILSGKSMVR